MAESQRETRMIMEAPPDERQPVLEVGRSGFV